jgi:hypothetical protein
MRIATIQLLAFAAMVLTGCGADSPRPSNQETASLGANGAGNNDRDLTLQAPTNLAVEVASPVELSRPAPEAKPQRRPRISPRPAPAPAPDPEPETSPATESAMPAPAVAVAPVVADPAPVEDVAVGVGRELPPGKTVTAIPASSWPSSAPEDPSWEPVGPGRGLIVEGGGRGGGTCRPRGGIRGMGVACRIPKVIGGRHVC